ncbi:MAG TPA: polyhydroxyalkanoic acid system family protein [Polyangiaceae bacterium]|jgi:hypothetical protein|nr:polyhydroxyalkanoic acid system family protein [Polyangiaceae bacterium]
MKHSVPHDLGIDLAKKAAVAAFDSYRARYAKYNPTATWATDDTANVSFTAKGMTLRGKLAVTPKTIDLDADIPFLLKPFSKVAIDAVEREIEKWVAKAKDGELS